MDSLDIQIVDSLTVNLNQEDYSTEGLALNNVDVYIEDEQLLFETALTQDSINLYTRETPDTIIFDAKEITDGISKLESLIEKTSKESTLTSGVNELKEAFANIDLSSVEQAIIDVKNAVTNIDFSTLAKEDTLTQGVNTISQKIDDIHIPELDKSDLAKEATLSSGISTLSNKIDNIDLSSVENKVDEGVETLSNKIDNIDLSSVERKVETESQAIQSAIQNVDLSSVESKVDEVKQAVENIDLTPIENKVQEGVNILSSKIDNIKLPEIDTTELAKESTLNAVSSKLDNLNVEVDLSNVAQQGDNQEATNSAIYESLGDVATALSTINDTLGIL